MQAPFKINLLKNIEIYIHERNESAPQSPVGMLEGNILQEVPAPVSYTQQTLPTICSV
jgi:hypothetical protein